MNNYLARINGRLTTPPWQFEFQEFDDAGAIRRINEVITSDFVGVPWLRAIDIFTTDTGDGMVTFNHERHVATIRLGTPITFTEMPKVRVTS